MRVRGSGMDEPEVCDRCGGEALRPATRRELLARWFTYGAGAGSAWYCRDCGASWSGGSSYAVLHHGPRWRRWVRLPLDVLEALRGARTWHPVPVFYAGVGGVALVPAVAVAALTRVRWWAALLGIPVAAMVGAFLWSLASAAGRGRRDVLWRLAPARAWRRDVEEELAGIREQAGAFPLLAPEGWPGPVSLEGASWSVPPRGPRVLQEVAVVADQGDPLLDPDRLEPGWRPRTPRVEIRVTNEPGGLPEEVATREFVDRAFPPAPPDVGDASAGDRRELERRLIAAHREHDQNQQRRTEELADGWREASLLVDGAPVAARVLTHGDADVDIATLRVDGRDVLVIAEDVALEGLRLVPVADPRPLVAELERRRRRRTPRPAHRPSG